MTVSGAPPFYITCPRYDHASAGNRILHRLASELEEAGHEAFICWTGPPGVDRVDDLRFRHLTEALSLEHFKSHRTPVCIRPEVSHTPPPVGVDVVYVLNYPGLLGGPAQISADDVIAYSERLQDTLTRCDGVVHLPACDPDFWTPGGECERHGACVYAGKYVEQHGQALPPEFSGARVITRGGRDAPGPEQIREVLRTSTHLYVFENTSVVTEALLCGCPVVIRYNPFFSEMIAAEEHGPWGMTETDDPAALERARSELPRFRAAYAEGFSRARVQVRTMAERTSRLARAREASSAFPVPRRVEVRERSSVPDLRAAVEDLDVAFAYNLFLGREVEDASVFDAQRGRALGEVLGDLLRSPEYGALTRCLLEGAPHSPSLTVVQGLEELKAWAERRVPLAREAGHALLVAASWPAVHAAMVADPAVTERFPGGEPAARAVAAALAGRSQRPDIRGHVDERSSGAVSGWALDLNAPNGPVRITVWRAGRLLMETVTGDTRPDVAGLAGGDGRAGFFVRAAALEGAAAELVVCAGAEDATLPPSAAG